MENAKKYDIANNTPSINILTLEFVDEFIEYLNESNITPYSYEKTAYNKYNDKFYVPLKKQFSKSYVYSATMHNKWGTADKSGVDLIFDYLNSNPSICYKLYSQEVDVKKTELANAKKELILEMFKRWLLANESRKNKVSEIIANTIASYQKQKIDGSDLEFENLSPNFKFYDYQKDGIKFALSRKGVSTLLAMNVGSGKTATIYGTVMKRNEYAKNENRKVTQLIVVANSTLTQFAEQIEKMHPDANIFVVEKKDFTKKKRMKTLKKIKEYGGDYDCILMPQSSFDLVDVSLSYQIEQLYYRLIEVEEVKDKNGYSSPLYSTFDPIIKSLKNKIDKLEKKQKEKKFDPDYDEKLCFDNLNIDYLYVDEAHNYKNISENAYSSTSAKANSMMNKVRIVQSKHDGGGVLFATGTSITNTMTEAFVLQKYLDPHSLEKCKIENINAWVGVFAKNELCTELRVDTTQFQKKSRLTNFKFLEELSNMIGNFTYFHMDEDELDIKVNRINVTIPQSKAMKEFQDLITERAWYLDAHDTHPAFPNDNFLAVCSDCRNACVDLRLYSKFTKVKKTDTKAWYAAENIAEIYHKYDKQRLTQIVFCDLGTPKEGFNFYDELKSNLIELGVKAEDIAYIHDATTETKRKKLFDEMNSGNIRVLIGSTAKLGIGVNVQQKLVACHHINPPWLPSEITQREGRIIRQGNENKEVFIYRYTCEKSLDAFSWQTLERKAGFINSFLSSQINDRNIQLKKDLDDNTLDYAQLKAISIGNENYKNYFELENEIKRLKLQRSQNLDEYAHANAQLKKQIRELENLGDRLEQLRFDERITKEKSDSEKRAYFRTLIMRAVSLKERNELYYTYRGFTVKIPKGSGNKVYLVGSTKYTCEIKSEKGCLTVMDNIIDSIPHRVESTEKLIAKKEENILNLQTQIKNFTTDTADRRINALEEQLEVLKLSLDI